MKRPMKILFSLAAAAALLLWISGYIPAGSLEALTAQILPTLQTEAAVEPSLSEDSLSEPSLLEDAASGRAPSEMAEATELVEEMEENQGFLCDGPKSSDATEGEEPSAKSSSALAWTCEVNGFSQSYRLEIRGDSPTSIRHVEASSMNYGSRDSDSVALDFLSFVVPLAYEGAQAAEAEAWVKQNVKEGHVERDFGSVRMRLEGSAEVRSLTMTVGSGPEGS